MNDHKDDSPYSTPDDIERLVTEFEACTLPCKEWTHHAHLAVGLWYASRHSEGKVASLIRDGIQRYNRACGVATTKTSGYHETITLFYVWVIRKYLHGTNKEDLLVNLVNGLISACGDKQLPLNYYSKERLMSWEARTSWLEPDLKTLD